jgi:hypothetical protein
MFIITQKCDTISNEFDNKKNQNLLVESARKEKELKQTLDRIEIIPRNNVQKPGSMKVFFSTKLIDFNIKPKNESVVRSNRKPSLNTTKDKVFSRENTLNHSKIDLSQELNPDLLNQNEARGSFNFGNIDLKQNLKDSEANPILNQLNKNLEIITERDKISKEKILGGVDQWLQKLSREGEIDMGRIQNLEKLGEEDFLLLNMKYHEDLKKSIEMDQFDDYVFSKNHSINLAFECDSIDLTISLISQFDCFINLQKNEKNLNKFYSCFSLQVGYWLNKLI